jgi:hypothetical protein
MNRRERREKLGPLVKAGLAVRVEPHPLRQIKGDLHLHLQQMVKCYVDVAYQCSPQTKLKAYWKGIVWVHIKGFGPTPNPTSKKTEHRRDMGPIFLKYAGENTAYSGYYRVHINST